MVSLATFRKIWILATILLLCSCLNLTAQEFADKFYINVEYGGRADNTSSNNSTTNYETFQLLGLYTGISILPYLDAGILVQHFKIDPHSPVYRYTSNNYGIYLDYFPLRKILSTTRFDVSLFNSWFYSTTLYDFDFPYYIQKNRVIYVGIQPRLYFTPSRKLPQLRIYTAGQFSLPVYNFSNIQLSQDGSRWNNYWTVGIKYAL